MPIDRDIYPSRSHHADYRASLLDFVDDANNAPAGTDWAKWKQRYRKRSPLFGQIIELFRASAADNHKSYKVIHHLIDQKDRKNCWPPLHWACSAGHARKIKILMDHGADPFILSNLNANMLHAAVESKALGGLAEALKVWRRSPQQLAIDQANHWGETPLHVAAWGSFECVNLLLQAGADRNARQEDNQVPLHFAGLSERGKLRRDMVALLCTDGGGSHVNAQDSDGRSPIFEFLNDTECMDILIRSGAKLDLVDTAGKTILHHAAIQDECEALDLLLKLSPQSVTLKDYQGNSPFILALQNRSEGCATKLLTLEDVGDIVGQDGWSAGHWAVKWGNAEILESVLIHSNYVKGAMTDDGKTLQVVAMEAGNWKDEIKELVRRHNSFS